MVRVAGLKQQLTGEVDELPAGRHDRRTSSSSAISVARARAAWRADGAPRCATRSCPRSRRDGRSSARSREQLTADALATLDERFHNEVFPILTPIAIDPGHPFPHVRNKSLNLGVDARLARGETRARRSASCRCRRCCRASSRCRTDGDRMPAHAFVLLEDLIARHVGPISSRASAASGACSLPRHPQLRPRDRRGRSAGPARRRSSRSSVVASAAPPSRSRSAGASRRADSLAQLVGARSDPIATSDGAALDVSDLHAAGRRADERRAARRAVHARRSCRRFATPTTSSRPSARATSSSTTRTSRSTRSSSSSSSARADDPHVLAIKQTLYRTGGDSPIVEGPGARRRERQAGHRARRAQGALRRGEQHRLGAHAREGGRPRRLRPRRPEDALQGRARRPPRARRAPPLRPPRAPATTTRRPRGSTPTSASSPRSPDFGEDATALFNLLTGYIAPATWHEAHRRAARPARAACSG